VIVDFCLLGTKLKVFLFLISVLCFQFRDVAKWVIINEKALAKFGYRADMKVKLLKESLIILVPCWNLV
jgi:hypothetical protein